MAGTNDAVRGIEQSESEWLRAHEALSRLAKERAAADAEEGRWLLAALRSAAHVHLGFGSFSEYVERLFGYRPRSTQEKLRVAAALEQLPAIAQALAEGALTWSAARELSRVAVAETEREWLESAHGKTVHQLEALVGGKILGDKPTTSGQSAARRHALRFDVAPETFALWREAMDQLRRSSNSPLDDDSALLLAARHILGGPRDEGRASYQIALSVCPQCGKGGQLASGEIVPISDDVVAMAHCDGQHLGLLPGPVNDGLDANCGQAANESSRADHRPDTSDLSDKNDGLGKTDGAQVSARDPFKTNAGRRSAGVGVRSAHVGARAKQTILPATRRAVRLRDQRRCVVPGCGNVRFLDLHHIELSSEGGRNDADNLVTLCGAHHRAVHRGTLGISGRVATGVTFRHADGSCYGHDVKPPVVEALALTFGALRGLGFREGEIRRALAEVSKGDDGREVNIEHLLRDALAKLTRTHERA